jgi:hypothetical protein
LQTGQWHMPGYQESMQGLQEIGSLRCGLERKEAPISLICKFLLPWCSRRREEWTFIFGWAWCFQQLSKYSSGPATGSEQQNISEVNNDSQLRF